MYLKKWNEKGSTLQIVLIVFMVMLFSLTICLSIIRFDTQNYVLTDSLMKQKNLEILLVDYYCQTIENDILMSDEYTYEGYEIQSSIDDLGSYYEIMTSVVSRKMNYAFIVQIHKENYNVLKFEYKEV